MGVLISNFFGTEFHLYDKKKLDKVKDERRDSNMLVSIEYVITLKL